METIDRSERVVVTAIFHGNEENRGQPLRQGRLTGNSASPRMKIGAAKAKN